MYWKIANAGTLPMAPAVSELRMFEQEDCTGTPIAIPTDGGWGSAAVQGCESGCSLCSGYSYGGPCSNAIDGDYNTEWRPNGYGGSAGVNWITVILTTPVRCISCATLGASSNYNPYAAYENYGDDGSSSSNMWGGGLAVSVSSDGVSWTQLVAAPSPPCGGGCMYAQRLNMFLVPA